MKQTFTYRQNMVQDPVKSCEIFTAFPRFLDIAGMVCGSSTALPWNKSGPFFLFHNSLVRAVISLMTIVPHHNTVLSLFHLVCRLSRISVWCLVMQPLQSSWRNGLLSTSRNYSNKAVASHRQTTFKTWFKMLNPQQKWKMVRWNKRIILMEGRIVFKSKMEWNVSFQCKLFFNLYFQDGTVTCHPFWSLSTSCHHHLMAARDQESSQPDKPVTISWSSPRWGYSAMKLEERSLFCPHS